MLLSHRFTFNALEENTYVAYDETGFGAIIDPGCADRHEQGELMDFIREKNITVKLLLNTHCHIDHVLGNSFVKEHYKVGLQIPKGEQAVLLSAKVIAPMYGYPNYQPAEPDSFFEDNSELKIGTETIKVLSVPGHSPGHVAFYHEGSGIVFGGDVLFYNSIGRADLPGGNYDTLIHSIHEKLFTLPNNTIVYPGHGPETTIGFEKKTNPFCAIER